MTRPAPQTDLPGGAEFLLAPNARCRSREAGLLDAQLADGHHKLARELSRATPAELAWQERPGDNTVGMLATHVAIAEVHLTDIGVRRLAESDIAAVLGMGPDGDGMPLAPGAAAPASLAGWAAEDFLALLGQARAHSQHHIETLADADLDLRFERPARTGGTRLLNVRWVLHHLQEHLLGHLGQVQLLLGAQRRRAGSPRGI